MANLYSQYASGIQFTAGDFVGSSLGTSGLNPIVDRLNSIAFSNNLVTGSVISGTSTIIYADEIANGIYPGEGIDITNGSVVSAELATATNRGVATFNTADFTLTNGSVAINNSTIFRSLTAGEGIDITGSTIAGENASTTNKGIVELATVAETQTGTDTERAVTPDSAQAVLSPIGAIIAWAKSMTSVPQTLPVGWVECDGSVISDAESVLNGETLPDLNGGEFLRGAGTSGGTGGSATHTHPLPILGNSTWTADGAGFSPLATDSSNTDAGGSLPPYYNVVWIMRIK